MPNPYHDETGRFCSKDEMQGAINRLGEKGDLEGYFKLRTEYEGLIKTNAPFEKEVQVKPELSKRGRPAKAKPTAAPIDTPISKLHEPSNRGDVTNAPGIEYDYDWYGTPDWASDNDGYGRNRVYEGLRITEVNDVRGVLANLFSCSPNDIPDELYDYAVDELHMDSPESYYIRGEAGYYGEEISITAEDIGALKRWYYKENNARDYNGVLDYVRSKGVDTSGKEPVQAIKDQLAFENNGKLLQAVKDARYVGIKNLTFKQVKANEKRMAQTVVPEESAVVKNKTAKEFAGVVVRDGKEYFLVDGYKRTKTLQGTRKDGEYIVLGRSQLDVY